MMDTTTFNEFYHTWFDHLHLLTNQLSGILATTNNNNDNNNSAGQVVEKVMAHYTELYRVKSVASEADVLPLFAAPWDSSLERSLHWVTGFRPTTVFHLIYTESSAKIESQMANLLSSHSSGDLVELIPGQLSRVSELQIEAVRAENEISGRLAEWQEGLAGMEWTAALAVGGGGFGERLREVVEAADQLRMDTLRKVVGLLTPRQGAELLVAFSQLLFGIRSWGLHQDRQQPPLN